MSTYTCSLGEKIIIWLGEWERIFVLWNCRLSHYLENASLAQNVGFKFICKNTEILKAIDCASHPLEWLFLLLYLRARNEIPHHLLCLDSNTASKLSPKPTPQSSLAFPWSLIFGSCFPAKWEFLSLFFIHVHCHLPIAYATDLPAE